MDKHRTTQRHLSHCGISELLGQKEYLQSFQRERERNKLFSEIKNKMSSGLPTATQEASRQ